MSDYVAYDYSYDPDPPPANGDNGNNGSDDTTLTNVEFWPDVSLQDFRAAERLRTDIPAARLRHALEAALALVNRLLTDFTLAQKKAGAESHADIERTSLQRQDHYKTLYLRAVYASAHADLLERYADYSATGDTGGSTGSSRADMYQDAAAGYRRTMRWALAEIEDRPHTTVELI